MAIRFLSRFQFRLLQPIVTAALVILLSACATYEYHETNNVRANRVSESDEQQIDEDTLLDVGIVLFDSGVDIMDDESAAYANVRESEAVWFSSQLKRALEYSNAWGIVRAVPNESAIMDVIVKGSIVESNGEILELHVQVTDASGSEWFSRQYLERASAYAYNPEVDYGGDPFKSLFNTIANDLFDHRAGLTAGQLKGIRNIAKVRFAEDFAPDTFSSYLNQSEDGIYSLQRIPAENDPMMGRIEQIQARNDLFLDVVQDYYRAFNRNMATPYEEWRKLSYKDVVYERQLRKQARQEKIAGIALLVAGVVASRSGSRTTSIGGYVGMLSGADLFRKGYLTQIESTMHAESLRELGQSLEAELQPSVIDLQDRSVTLSGTVEDQYKEWRRILAEMFEADQIPPLPDQTNVPPVQENNLANGSRQPLSSTGDTPTR